MATTDSQRLFEAMLRDTARRNPNVAALFYTRQPKYRYFVVKGSQDQPFWTTETVRHQGKDRYVSGIYHYLTTTSQFQLRNERYHAKRKDAKQRALDLYHRIARTHPA